MQPNNLKIALVFDNSGFDNFKKDGNYSLDKFELNNPDYIPVIELIKKALESKGYTVDIIALDYPITKIVKSLETGSYDLIFNLCEGFYNDSVLEVNIAALYELLQIEYTGNPADTLRRCLNKKNVKNILENNDIRTPNSTLVYNAEELKNISLTFPLIVKPVEEDASEGISNESVVDNNDALTTLVKDVIEEYGAPVLVEEYIDGREFNVAIVGNNYPKALPVSEIDFSSLPKNYFPIVTYNAKWEEDSIEYNSTIPICPAKISEELKSKLENIALQAYELIECRDYARIDMRMSHDNEIFVLEVNPNPDISPDAGLANASRANGWSYEQMICNLVSIAVERLEK